MLHRSGVLTPFSTAGADNMLNSDSKGGIEFSEQVNGEEVDDEKGSIISKENSCPDTCIKQAYICGGCNASFQRLHLLKKHKCNVGNISFLDEDDIGDSPKDRNNTDSSSDLDSKLMTVDESKTLRVEEKSFHCTACPKKYTKIHYLTKHFALAHNGNMPWKCANCSEEFSSSIKFKEHCKQHGILKPFKCDKCESFFKSCEVLRVHDRTHTGERPFSCKTCGRRFKQSSNLQDHIRKHKNDRSFICGTCGKSFNLKGDLTKHLLLHTGERKFRCHYCPKAFPGVSNYNRHMRTHTGVKPFTCSYCQKSFPRKERLKEHERIHTGERPFTCPVCGKSFSDSGNFSNHKRGHEDSRLQKWKRFPKKPTASLSPSAPFENQNVEDTNANEDTMRPDALCSIAPSQPLKIVLALPSQLVCYVNSHETEPVMCLMGKEVDSKVTANLEESALAASSLQQKLQVLSEKCEEQSPESLNVHEEAESSSQPTAEGVPGTSLCSIATSVPDGRICDTVTHTAGDNLAPFDFVTSVDGLAFSDSFSLPENCQSVILTPTKFLPALKPLFDHGLQKVDDSTDKKEDEESTGCLEDINSTVANDTDGCKDASSFSSSVSGSIADTSDKYCASNLTLMDLSKADDTQSYNCPSNYLIPHDVDAEPRKLGRILLATPTKSYPEEKSHSPSSIICSQILVTPEHASLPLEVADIAKVKRRVLEL